MHQRHAGLFQQRQHKILIGLEQCAAGAGLAQQRLAGREHIEGPLRRQAIKARTGIEPGHHHVAPRLEHLPPLGQKVLRPVERFHRSPLRNRGRAARRLALQLGHRRQQRPRPGAEADAPAGHGMRLGHAIHRQRAALQPGLHLGDGGKAAAVIDQHFIDIVGQDVHMRMRQQHIGQPAQLGRRIGRARRVRRRIEQQPLGLGRDRRFQHGRRQLEAGRGVGYRKHRLGAAQPHDFRIAHPIGHRHHHLVAGVQRRHQRVEDDLLAARGHKAIGCRDVQAIVALELGRHRRLELGNAVDIGVARLAGVHRRLGCVAHIERRIEIRLAGRERDDVAALLRQFARLLADGHGRRRRHPTQCFRQEPHHRSPTCDGRQ